MQISRLDIKNFRGIRAASILLPKHSVLIGDNNTGKTTLLEAIDLALGPDRLNRKPPVDEHDFYQGKYTVAHTNSEPVPDAEAATAVAEPSLEGPKSDGTATDCDGAGETPQIEIEVTVTDLTDEQRARFGDYIEFWNHTTDSLYDQPDAPGVDAPPIAEALRVTFVGSYDLDEDDFEGKTYFTRSLSERETPVGFSKTDKQICGFLYLRSIRTGSRALSLERGSLLDIILRLKEVRPQMWEDTIGELAGR